MNQSNVEKIPVPVKFCALNTFTSTAPFVVARVATLRYRQEPVIVTNTVQAPISSCDWRVSTQSQLPVEIHEISFCFDLQVLFERLEEIVRQP